LSHELFRLQRGGGGGGGKARRGVGGKGGGEQFELGLWLIRGQPGPKTGRGNFLTL